MTMGNKISSRRKEDPHAETYCERSDRLDDAKPHSSRLCPPANSRPNDPKAVIAAFGEAIFVEKNFDALPELMHEDYIPT